MFKISLVFFSLGLLFSSRTHAQETSNYESNQTVTYNELIDSYKELTASYNTCDLMTFGLTDSGKPLHLFLINSSSEFYPEALQKKSIILIQNGIHAGEPCGVDASLKWATEMLQQGTIPENVVIAIIPVYNIGGMLNRGKYSRANQNGPEEHGFRGNARNLDLNRDYIKNDSKNAESFTRLFHWLKPHLFVDTHTSNGADYQYTMTLLTARKERLHPVLGEYLYQILEPYIFDNYVPLTPYVNVWGTTPNNGIKAFNDLPRYSTGYVSLFNCIGFTTEAHMWKPFDDRVAYTLKFLKLITKFSDENAYQIIANKKIADQEFPKQNEPINFEVDTNQFDTIEFLSYAPEYRYSEILGKEQLYYNKDKPETIEIKYYNDFVAKNEIETPKYYVVKSAWSEVISRLKRNNIVMTRIDQDTVLSGVGQYITSYKSPKTPYEGHFLHNSIEVKDSNITMQFFSGDYIIPVNQVGWKYLMNVLEPVSEDGFFAWNFYDEIVQQKEWYSSYVFEPYAQKMLDEDVILKAQYESKIESDSAFAKNGNYRLYWLYQQSPYYEKEHNRYPVLKIFE